MPERIEWIKRGEEAEICRCYGSEAYLELPERIAGCPVTSLADHCFAAEPSSRLQGEKRRMAVRTETGEWMEELDPGEIGSEKISGEKISSEKSDCEEPLLPICAERLRELWLPKTLRCAGAYAFYGCRRLRALHFPAGFENLGGGAFVAANHLEQIFFETAEGQNNPPCMKDILGEITYEVEAVVERNGQTLYHLIYPEYYEESVENTPARIIAVRYQGTGYKYRQCFKGRELDFKQYDNLFYEASVQEFLPTLFPLVFHRLCYPVSLGGEERLRYLDFLKREHPGTAAYVVREGRPDLLRLLKDQDYFTPERLEEFLRLAGEWQRAEMVSILMEYRRERFPTRQKKYLL